MPNKNALHAYMSTHTPTLYEQLGGQPAVDAAVEPFYRRFLPTTVSAVTENTDSPGPQLVQRRRQSRQIGVRVGIGAVFAS